MSRSLHLNVNILHAGYAPGAWRLPGSDPRAAFDIEHYVGVARIAERGTLDAVFLADFLGISDRLDYRPILSLDPSVVLATVAARTEHIGLIATISTSFTEPYDVARRFATLDHASNGRVGLNLVTTADPSAARNFGTVRQPHADRYARAGEYADVLKSLWDSWEDGAFVGDVATGRFVDIGRVRPIAHAGRFFAVEGPLQVPRPPQGHPVLFQAGGSEDGRALAARHAEAVFSASQDLDEAKAYAADLRARARAFGRTGGVPLNLAGLATFIASTEAEARERQEALQDLIPIEYGHARIAGIVGLAPDRLALDAPLPDDLPVPVDGMQTFFRATVAKARREGLTVRALIRALDGGVGHRSIVGTPDRVADDIETWFRSGAVDGFNLMPDVLPQGLEVFVDEVVPILRERGLFRTAYAGRTLRDHLGLAVPARSRRPAA